MFSLAFALGHGYRRRLARGEVDEAALVGNFAVPVQPRQQSERVIGQQLVPKGLLSFQRLDGTAGGQRVRTVQSGIEDLRVEFRDRKQTVLGMLIAPVPSPAADTSSSCIGIQRE